VIDPLTQRRQREAQSAGDYEERDANLTEQTRVADNVEGGLPPAAEDGVSSWDTRSPRGGHPGPGLATSGNSPILSTA